MREVGAQEVNLLFAHQQRALEFLRERPEAAAVFAGLGTGKTRMILEDAREKDAALVVVCPKTAISVWEQQVALWQFMNPVYLINYDRVWRNPNKNGINKELVAWMKQQVKPVMLVLDESHKIKDRTTKQSRGCRKLAAYAQHRRVLSGTPVLNHMGDLWAQFNFLVGDWPSMELWQTWKKFAADHVIFNPIFPGKVDGIRNVHTLQKQLAPLTFQVRTDDVLDLPPATDLYRECELEPQARKIYNNVERQLFAELEAHEIEAPTTLVKLLRLAQVTGGFVHASSQEDGASEVVQVSRAKLDLLRDVVEEIGPEPFVVFVRFTAERLAIEEMLRHMGIARVSLAGDQLSSDRRRSLEAFHGGTQAMVANLAVGSASIDLTPARYACYFSVGFSFGDYTQSRGRIYRQGQSRPCFYAHLTAKSTIDEYIYSALRRKAGTASAVREWWEARCITPAA